MYEETQTDCEDGEVCVEGSCFGETDINLIITELHYNPSTSQGDDSDFEFIEIYNAGMPVNLEGYSFGAGITHTFGSFDFAPQTYIVVAANAASYSGDNVIEWTSGTLSNSGETVTLQDATGAVLTPLPSMTRGTGVP